MILEKINLGEVVTIQGGGTPSRKKAAYWGGNIPWASVKDLGSFHLSSTQETITSLGVTNSSTRVVPPGTVIVGTRMSIGNPCINTVPIAINQDLKAITPSSRVHNRYLMWFLHYSEPHLESNATGATVKGIKLEHLHKLKIPLPPLPEQRRIAAILDQADAIRQKRRQAIAMTEELLRSTFLEMFGDPVTNPKGWPEQPLSKFGEIITGNTPSRKDPRNFGQHIEWIKTDNITGVQNYLTPATEYLSEKGQIAGREVKPGAILIACIAGSLSSIGKVAIADRNVTFNQQINAIQPNTKKVTTPFLYAMLKLGQKKVQDISTKGMKGLVSKGRLSKLEMMIPPLSEQQHFNDFFNTYLKLRNDIEQTVNIADNLFHALVQQAFQGKL